MHVALDSFDFLAFYFGRRKGEWGVLLLPLKGSLKGEMVANKLYISFVLVICSMASAFCSGCVISCMKYKFSFP